MSNGASFISKLEHQMDLIRPVVYQMFDNSEIYYRDPNRNSGSVLFIGFSVYHYSRKDERSQLIAKSKYTKFYQDFELLIEHATPSALSEIKKANKEVIELIEQEKAPLSVESGKQWLDEQFNVFNRFLKLLDREDKAIIIVPDTNSIIQYPEPKHYKSIAENETYQFVILPTVLSELDKHKMTHRNEEFRKKVASVIQRLKGYRKQGDILTGVIVDKTITVRMIATEPDFSKTLNWIDSQNNDDRIVANVLQLQVLNASDRIILVTSDINLQNKAEMANLTVFDTDELAV